MQNTQKDGDRETDRQTENYVRVGLFPFLKVGLKPLSSRKKEKSFLFSKVDGKSFEGGEAAASNTNFC